ncbi:ABC-transporter [Fomitopsis serialis]|uniref:ABC-transporter n=1 Tax=Fomitopsis serialis TaxID=139415 RepID=UPI0020077FED|nr:ABC-transporter [Neoantrodia serialis]KAH9929730.1 ABC-transporter [Neoantrodia serialis]
MTDTPGDDRTLFGSVRAPPHVDVVQAEAEFNQLSRALTKRSVSDTPSENEKGEKEHRDVEKDVSILAEEPFDLRAYLTSSNDANQSAGIQHKHVGVTWEQLQVDVFGGLGHKHGNSCTFADEIVKFGLTPYYLLKPLVTKLLPASRKQVPTSTIIHPQSGLLKPGEMCLVLGTPGSGCTTFLKTIANERREYHGVYGDVRYAGIDAHEMAKHYRGEVVYNMEDDIHIATLTVSQTLNFALSLKTPGPTGRLPGMSRQEFQSTVLNTLLRMLNISHTANTLVGDEFVRGVSGGERKRVSIAEMMATRAHVVCFDNSTRGLDASTALDFVKSLRIMTDVLGQTVFVTLYQAGESIYELFDKVLVLDKGRQVYFGSPSQARAYFEGLGFKPLPRQSTPDYLTGCTDPNERQFAPGRSEADVPTTPEQLEQAFLQSPFAQDVQDSLVKYKGVMEHDKADQEAFRTAVAADKKRGVSKKSPYTQGFLNQVRALFWRQFQMRLQDRFQIYTSFTLHTRRVLFASLLTAALDTFGEMPVQMLGRPIIKKQTGYSLYRPAAIAIANTLADMPFSASRVFIYNVIIYFMAGLNRSAGGFFTFHLITYLTFLTMQGFFRTFGFMCTNFDSAFRLATFFLPNMIMYAGYMIPVFQMKRWLFWILECDGSYITPRNPPGVNKYPWRRPNQICTLYGSTPGESVVSGHSYVDLTQVLLVEFYPVYFGAAGVTIYSEDAETKERNRVLQERKARREQKRREGGNEKQDVEESPVPEGSKRLLHDVFGYCKPGTMTALMGSSGAEHWRCFGELLMDGRPLASDFARKTAYAEQMDVHEGTATVREAMRFSAYLRQPYHISQEEKDAYVEEMIEVLELQDLADAVVFSLGVEARKRLTIGVELASKPSLLFLDEPTSGLDGQSAWNLVRFLRKLADNGQAILCTIHQPSSMLIQTFDKLLLLERGGETVYFGDIGQDSAILRSYFAKHGAVCPSNVNPAEFMLDAIGAGLAPRIGDRDWKDVWLGSEEYAEVRREIDRMKHETAAKSVAANEKSAMYATPFFYQLKVVVARNNSMLWRSPDYVWSRLFVHAFISLFVSLPFLQLGNDTRDLQYRVFFWVSILPAIVMGQLEPMWIINRRIFVREASSRIYSPYVFAIGQLIGRCRAAGVGGTFFQLLPFFTLGQLIGAISPSMQIAPLFNPFVVVVLGIFCGVQIPYPTMESFWRTWLYQLDPYTRLLSSMLSVELHGLQIQCAAEEFVVFSPPSAQTCQQWAGDFVDYYGGYLNNPNATSACQYCEYSVGDEFFTPLNILYSNRWRDVFILLAYSVFNIIATVIASRFLRYAKR